VVLALLACEAPFSFPPPVARVTVTPGTVDLVDGDSVQLQATATDSGGRALGDHPVAWSSSDPATIHVTAGGLVIALAPGGATITATIEAVRGSAAVRAGARVVHAVIDQGDLTLVPGGVVPLHVTPRDRHGLALGGRTAVWESSDPSVARIAPSGVVTALAAGPATIHVAVDGVRDSVVLTVAPVRFTTIDAGEFRHSCARASTGAVFCWGENALGQLGIPGLERSSAPLRASGAPTFAQVTAGGTFTCGLDAAALARCWGSAARGRLGDGSTADRPDARPVPLLVPLRGLSAGWNQTCGIGPDAEGICWGEYPQVGGGAGPIARTPVPVSGGLAFRQIAAGEGFTCGLTVDSLAYCWGTNLSSRMGVADLSLSATPVSVSGAPRFTAVAAGGLHACALDASGAAWCWGSGASGQLGAGTAVDSSATPLPVTGGRSFRVIATGSSTTCAIATTGEAYCWGSDDAGQLGAPAPDLCGGLPCARGPVAVAGGLRFTAIAVGDHHTCALATDGAAYCWGLNDRGQLGDGTEVDRPAPVPVIGQR
jgi:alpha-tubulin suppressor-like RCC1 family protein